MNYTVPFYCILSVFLLICVLTYDDTLFIVTSIVTNIYSYDHLKLRWFIATSIYYMAFFVLQGVYWCTFAVLWQYSIHHSIYYMASSSYELQWVYWCTFTVLWQYSIHHSISAIPKHRLLSLVCSRKFNSHWLNNTLPL